MRKLIVSALAGALLTLALMGQSVRSQTPPPPPPGGTPPTIGPPPPPCPPGCPTDTPTATPAPTSTPIPLTVNLKLAHKSLSPRQKQTVSVTTMPGATVAIQLKYPNGDNRTHSTIAGTGGAVSWKYTQPGSRITHTSRTATVTVKATLGTQSQSSVKKYTIGFAKLDVSVQPRKVKRGHAIAIWVHTTSNTPIRTVLRYPKKYAVTLTGETGTSGWLSQRYTVPTSVHTGHVAVQGYARLGNRMVSGITSFTAR
jgi:hypothetical protein